MQACSFQSAISAMSYGLCCFFETYFVKRLEVDMAFMVKQILDRINNQRSGPD